MEVCICLYVRVHSALFACALKVFWRQDINLAGEGGGGKKSNYSAPSMRRGEAKITAGISVSLFASSKMETPASSNGNSIFSEEILDERKTCSLEIQHSKRSKRTTCLSSSACSN